MRHIKVSEWEIGLISATRAMLGFGVGLLLAARVRRQRRIVLGSILASFGAVSTIPFVVRAVQRHRALASET
jgi:hypothetical protein